MRHTVFTTGYHGHTVDELVTMCEALQAVVVDIRYNPYGFHFSQGKVQRALPAGRYCWIRDLGNAGYKESRLDIVDLEAGITRLQTIADKAPALLVCACASASSCHRTAVADVLRQSGWRVQEIDLGQVDVALHDCIRPLKKRDVEVGGEYRARVGDRICRVKIELEQQEGGWLARNQTTNRTVQIRSARRLWPLAATDGDILLAGKKTIRHLNFVDRYSFDDINRQTYFAVGEKWRANEIDEPDPRRGLKAFFNVDNLKTVIAERIPTQGVLDEMLSTILRNRWHVTGYVKKGEAAVPTVSRNAAGEHWPEDINARTCFAALGPWRAGALDHDDPTIGLKAFFKRNAMRETLLARVPAQEILQDMLSYVLARGWHIQK